MRRKRGRIDQDISGYSFDQILTRKGSTCGMVKSKRHRPLAIFVINACADKHAPITYRVDYDFGVFDWQKNWKGHVSYPSLGKSTWQLLSGRSLGKSLATDVRQYGESER
jgi:hypothetical protein